MLPLLLALATSPADAAGGPSVDVADVVQGPRLTTRTLTSPERAGGVRWPAGTSLTETDAGALESAYVKLDAEWSTGGHLWPAGTTLMFDTGHNALWASRQLVAPERIGAVDWPAGAVLSFDSQGTLTAADLLVGAPTTWAGVTWDVGTRLQVDPTGRVYGAQRTIGAARADGTPGPTRVAGVDWPAGAVLFLDPATGDVTSGSLQVVDGSKVGGVTWPPMTSLGFDARGRVTSASCWVAQPLTWRGKAYAENTSLTLDPRTGAVVGEEHPLDHVEVE